MAAIPDPDYLRHLIDRLYATSTERELRDLFREAHQASAIPLTIDDDGTTIEHLFHQRREDMRARRSA